MDEEVGKALGVVAGLGGITARIGHRGDIAGFVVLETRGEITRAEVLNGLLAALEAGSASL